MSAAHPKQLNNLKDIQSSRRILGRSDLNITPIGFGAWAIGGGQWEFAWGSQEDTDSVAAIRRAISLGVNWVDTAAVYGLGHSEEVVGQALTDIPHSERPYIFTKCSLVWNRERAVSHSLRAASIRAECEQSLRRLRLDSIDLYQIHWPAWKGGPESDSPGSVEEALGEMAKLRSEGKIRHIGVSNFNLPQLERASEVTTIASLQPPYSMLRPAVEKDLLPWCRTHNIGVIVYSPMLSGLLTGSMTKERAASFPEDDWRRNNSEFQEPRLSKNLELVEKLREIGSRHGRTPGEVAIAWTLRNSAVTGAIVGGRNAKQVEGVVGAALFRLSENELKEIDRDLANR